VRSAAPDARGKIQHAASAIDASFHNSDWHGKRSGATL
jgi:hypothetical protein